MIYYYIMAVEAVSGAAHKEVAANFMWRSLQTLGKQGVIFAIFIICAKLLSVYEFGIYNYLLAIIYLCALLGDFGISAAASKYAAEYNTIDRSKLRLVLFSAGAIILFLALAVSAFMKLFGRTFLAEKYRYFLYLAPLIFFMPMTSLYDGIYMGLKRFRTCSLITVITGLICIAPAFVLIRKYGLVGALMAQNIFYASLLLALAAGYREFSLKLDKGVIAQIGRYSLLLGLASVGIFLYMRFDVIMLGLFGYIDEIAYYELVNRILVILTVPWLVLCQVIAPDVTAAFSRSDVDYVRIKFSGYSRLSLLYGSIIAAAFFIVGRQAIPIFLPDYNRGMFHLFLLAGLVVFPVRLFGTVLVSSFIVPTGNARIVTYINLIFALVRIALNYVLIAAYGAAGIAVSMVVLDYAPVFIARHIFVKSIKKGSGLS